VAPPKRQKSGSKAMSHPGRALAALLVLIIVMAAIITGKDAFSPGNWHKDFKVALGLDLAGGTQVTLSATTLNGKQPKPQDMTTAISIMNSRVDAQGFNNAQVQQQGSNFITVTVPGKNAQQVVNLVGTTALLFFRQVYLEGTADANTSSTPTSTPTPSSTGSTGTSPSAKSSGSPSSSPGSSSSAKASDSPSPSAAGDFGSSRGGQTGGQGMASQSKLLAATAPKAGSSSKPKPSSSASSTPSSGTSPSPTPTVSTPATNPDISGEVSMVKPDVLKLFNQLNCNDKDWKQKIHYSSKQYDQPGAQIVSCSPASPGVAAVKYVLGPVVVNGTDVTNAQAGLPNAQQSLNSTDWQVNLSFNGRGTKAFGAITTTMYSKYGGGGNPTSVLDQLAVVLDGVVVSAPNIDQGAITGGNAQITGTFSESQATTLANQLQYGALPINLHEQDVESVSASLGRNQLVAGLVAAAIGLGLVVIYSFLYYRGLGLVSVSSLIVASVLAYLTVVMLSKYASSGFSLSLAGIAGLIVAIGITADSFVVFFERLRDEVRDGRSLRPAVESGWRRARRTILVSDTVSFLCALLLWYFSVSDVKGFAFTLGLTTLIDVIVVFLFTKPMVTLLAKTRFFSSGHPMSGLDPKRLGARAPWRSGIQRSGTRVNVKES
jgi:preprotein translocase subunit SecD